MHHSTTPPLSQTIWPRWALRQFPRPPNSRDLAPCGFWLLPKLRGCRYETIEEMKEAVTKVIDTLHTRGLPWGLPEVVGTVQQVLCSRRSLLRRGLEFHVYTINKSAHTKKKSGNLFNDPRTCWSLYLSLILHPPRMPGDPAESGYPGIFTPVSGKYVGNKEYTSESQRMSVTRVWTRSPKCRCPIR